MHGGTLADTQPAPVPRTGWPLLKTVKNRSMGKVRPFSGGQPVYFLASDVIYASCLRQSAVRLIFHQNDGVLPSCHRSFPNGYIISIRKLQPLIFLASWGLHHPISPHFFIVILHKIFLFFSKKHLTNPAPRAARPASWPGPFIKKCARRKFLWKGAYLL